MVGSIPAASVAAAPDLSWVTVLTSRGDLWVSIRGGLQYWYPGMVPEQAGRALAAATRVGGRIRAAWAEGASVCVREFDVVARTKHPLLRFKVAAQVRAVTFMAQGATVAVFLDDGVVQGVDVITGRIEWTLRAQWTRILRFGGRFGRSRWEPYPRAPEVRALAAGDGHVVVAYDNGVIERFDVGLGRSERVFHPDFVHAVAITVDGSVVVIADDSGLLRWTWSAGVEPRAVGFRLELIGLVAALAVTSGARVAFAVFAGRELSAYYLGLGTEFPAMDYPIPDRRIVIGDPGEASVSAGRDVYLRDVRVQGFGVGTVVVDQGLDDLPRPGVDRDVQFTVYRPRTVPVDTWVSMMVFAHKTTVVEQAGRGPVDPIEQVAQRARTYFAGGAAPPNRISARAGLERGARIRVVPELPGLACNPAQVELDWRDPVHECAFQIRASSHMTGQVSPGAVRIWCGPLIIGEVFVEIPIGSAPGGEIALRDPAADSAFRYRKIFPSYSQRDGAIVTGFAEAARALGDTYLRDVLTLRSGERWEPRILELIEDADVFQLFWSHSSMRSPHCRKEWEYALDLRRPSFVRPMFWEDPLPTDPREGLPPKALLDLQFARVRLDSVGRTVQPGSSPDYRRPLGDPTARERRVPPYRESADPSARERRLPPYEESAPTAWTRAPQSRPTRSAATARAVAVIALIVVTLVAVLVVIHFMGG